LFEFADVARCEFNFLVVVFLNPGVDQLGEFLPGQALIRVDE
jgi:hypothetical protein